MDALRPKNNENEADWAWNSRAPQTKAILVDLI